MASFLRLFNLLLISSLFNGVDGIPEHELFAMVSALRSRGYHLFGNALMTSDIHYEILLGSSFTFFAPTDSSLFALDMTTTASDYVQTLRFHVVPRRFSVAFLRSLPSGSSLPTLLPHHQIFISEERTPYSNLITVNGVDVVFPALFYSRDIAVHGLSSILILHHRRQSPIGSAQAQHQSTDKSTTKVTNASSPSMNVTDPDKISPGFLPDCVPIDRCFSPAETPVANPPTEDKIAPVRSSPDCVPAYDHCLSDSAEAPTANPTEEGSLANLESFPLSEFLPPATPAVAPPDDRHLLDYLASSESLDTHHQFSAPAPGPRISEIGDAPVGDCGAYEKGLKTNNGIHGSSTYCSIAGDWVPCDGSYCRVVRGLGT